MPVLGSFACRRERALASAGTPGSMYGPRQCRHENRLTGSHLDARDGDINPVASHDSTPPALGVAARERSGYVHLACQLNF